MVSLPLFGCAAALSEPPPLSELTGTRPDDTVRIDRLLAEAERRFARREVEAVRRSADLWLQEQKEARLAAAVSAVQSAQWCERIAPDDPSCIYYLALALGVQARERRSTGHDALKEMVERLEHLIEHAPVLDHAGPHRVLALVLLRSPGWPSGPGDSELGLEHAVNAVHIDPDYPPNQLCFGEALAATGSRDESFRAYERGANLARAWMESGEIDAKQWLAEAEQALARHRGE